ncbi:hypothetical protein [Sicyoidochytrium minutum DNA virus]|nr:hypothetical protein [Sicyoidochytrium minutum DNA virus]BDC16821.1 hypothetical protein [Sicyoidochytrium minutum DNA virus]
MDLEEELSIFFACHCSSSDPCTCGFLSPPRAEGTEEEDLSSEGSESFVESEDSQSLIMDTQWSLKTYSYPLEPHRFFADIEFGTPVNFKVTDTDAREYNNQPLWEYIYGVVVSYEPHPCNPRTYIVRYTVGQGANQMYMAVQMNIGDEYETTLDSSSSFDPVTGLYDTPDGDIANRGKISHTLPPLFVREAYADSDVAALAETTRGRLVTRSRSYAREVV